MTVGVYARVSSTSQKLDSQRTELQRWLDQNGHSEVEWFSDHGESGENTDRPEFRRLQAAIFAGDIKTVVCWKLDRLSRSLRDGVNVLADWCERDVRVIVVTQQLDLSGAVGKMMAAVLLGLAEIEMETRRERQASGIAVAKRRGVYRGRKAGSTKARPQRARQLSKQGLSQAEIAAALGVSDRTIRRYLA